MRGSREVYERKVVTLSGPAMAVWRASAMATPHPLSRSTFASIRRVSRDQALDMAEREATATGWAKKSDDWFYGEVGFDAMAHALSRVEPKRKETFLDLGSGTGNAVMAAALTQPFEVCRGVERLSSLHEIALQALASYESDTKQVIRSLQTEAGEGVPSAETWPFHVPKVEFVHGDLLHESMEGVDVVYSFATCFGRELFNAMAWQLEALRPGARVLLVSKSLISPSFELVECVGLQQTHTEAAVDCYIYHKRY